MEVARCGESRTWMQGTAHPISRSLSIKILGDARVSAKPNTRIGGLRVRKMISFFAHLIIHSSISTACTPFYPSGLPFDHGHDHGRGAIVSHQRDETAGHVPRFKVSRRPPHWPRPKLVDLFFDKGSSKRSQLLKNNGAHHLNIIAKMLGRFLLGLWRSDQRHSDRILDKHHLHNKFDQSKQNICKFKIAARIDKLGIESTVFEVLGISPTAAPRIGSHHPQLTRPRGSQPERQACPPDDATRYHNHLSEKSVVLSLFQAWYGASG